MSWVTAWRCCAVNEGVDDKAADASRQQGASSATVQSVERAAQILRLLGDNGQQGVAELAAALGVARGTVHGLLQSLASAGLVQQATETDRYGLGPALVDLGSRYLRADNVRVCASRWARSLARETNHVVQVGTLYGLDVLVVNHVGRPEDNVHVSDLGSLYPAHATAVGKVLLAHDDVAINSLLGSSDGDQTLEPRRRLRCELVRVFKQGWAIGGAGIGAGEASIACPIVSRGGEVIGAIGAFAAAGQLLFGAEPRPELLERVGSAARGISRDLGGRGW
jgi:DNA-binding IclR family transcriptional regulator